MLLPLGFSLLTYRKPGLLAQEVVDRRPEAFSTPHRLLGREAALTCCDRKRLCTYA